MITLNLLPDSKQEFVKAKRTRDRLVFWSVSVAGFFIGVLVIFGSALGIQWFVVDSTRNQIEELSQELENEDSIINVLTVQNQLQALPQIHSEKPKATRFFRYLSAVVPETVNLNSTEIDFDNEIIEISGEARSVRDFNALVDILKVAEYNLGPEADAEDPGVETLSTQLESELDEDDFDETGRAFREVVSDLSVDSTSEEVNFSIELRYNPEIFSRNYAAVVITVSDTSLEDILQEDEDVTFEAENQEGGF